jgi:hypothetical protein
VATLAPSALVTGPARAPIAFGLGSVFTWRNGDRFESGITWDALTCDPAQGRGGPACAPDVPVGLPKNLVAGPGIGEATAFVVWGEYACSPIGGGWSEAQDRALAHLTAREEARAEQAFWTGDLGNTPNLSGANGFDAPIDLGEIGPVWTALAAVEQGIATEYGSLGTIHVSVRTASLLLSKGSLEKRGGRLYTELGTPVVAGAGYPDVPEIIGTAALVGYRSEVFTSSNRQGDLLDRATNDLVAIAERSYAIGFDPCPVVKASYTPDEGGSSTPKPPLTTLTLTAFPLAVSEGEPIMATAVGDEPPTGTVSLYSSIDGGTTWVNDGAMTKSGTEAERSFDTTGFAGAVSLQARSGTVSSNIVVVTVNPRVVTSVVLTATPNPVTVGEPITVTATTDETPTATPHLFSSPDGVTWTDEGAMS